MWWVRFLLRLRYQIRLNGSVPQTNAPIIVFCSLTSQLDPLLIASVFPKSVITCHPRESITMPWLVYVYRFLGWWPLLDRDKVNSAFIRRRFTRVLEDIKRQIIRKQTVLFFPKGHVQLVLQPMPADLTIEQEILQNVPFDPVVIYADVEGMLGSLFSSRSFGGKEAGSLTFKKVMWLLVRNGLFFMPKRKIVIELSAKESVKKNQEVQFVPHFLSEKPPPNTKDTVVEQIFEKIAQLSKKHLSQIHLEQNLYENLMLDSLDITELTVWVREVFDLYVPFEKLETVNDVVRAVTGAYEPPDRQLFEKKKHSAWFQNRNQSLIPRSPQGETIIEAFLTISDIYGSHIACVDPFDMMSYQRLKSAVIGLAEPLRLLPGKHVGILLNSSIQFNVAFLALLFAGKIPTPINWTLGSKHVEEAIRAADIQVILTAKLFIDHLKIDLPVHVEEKIQFMEEIIYSLTSKQKIKSLQLTRASIEDILHHFNLDKVKAHSEAALVFTSGSEGHPKGVMLTHDNILANQRSLFPLLDLTENDVEMGILPAFHVYGLSFANLMPLLCGYRVVFAPNLFDFELNAKMVQMWKVTFIATTPTFLKTIIQTAQLDQLQSVRFYSIGAESAPLSLYDTIRNLPNRPNLIEGYGVTECSPCLTLNRHALDRKGVGFPLPGVKLMIIDPDAHQVVKAGHSGLVCAAGDNVFEGYLGGAPDPFIRLQGQKWYNTGDLGHLEPDGALILEGRLSRSIKIGGELVYLQELEKVVQNKLPHAEVSIVAHNQEEKPNLILYVTQPVDLATVNQWLHDAGLSNLLRLQEVKIMSQLPRLATGKIDYGSLLSR